MESSSVDADQMRLASQTIVNRLSSKDGSRGAIVQTLMAVGDVLAPLGVIVVGFVAYDSKTNTVRCKLAVRNGAELTIAGTLLDDDWPVDRPPMALPWSRLQNEDFIWGLTSDTTVLVPEVRSFHEADGTRAVAYQPLRRAKQTMGWVALSLRSELRPTRDQISFIQNLAGHIAVALEMQRLADISRDAAVALEKGVSAKQRLDELVKVNEALRSTVAVMVEQPELDHFLGRVLQVLIERLEALGADLWIYRPDDDAIDCRLVCVDGEVTTQPPPVAGHPFPLVYPFSAVETSQILNGAHRFEQNFLEIVANMSTDGLAWYSGNGVKAVLRVPISIQKQVIGNIAIWKKDTTPFASEQLELALALAQQAALAIHAERLAERARDAAVANERQIASEQRAAEAARANLVLRRSVAKLADVGDVKQALVEAVRAAAGVLDADGGALGIYSPQEKGFRTLFQVVGDQVSELGSLNFENRLYGIDEGPIQLAWEAFHKGDGVLWCPLDGPYFTEDSRAYLAAQGMNSSVLLAVRRGTECVGYLGFSSRQSSDLTVGQRELLEAISDQVSLMLELSRLADVQRQTAIALERESAAQVRAAELGRANAALSRSVAAVSHCKDFDAALHAVFTEITTAANASTAFLFEYREQSNTLATLLWTDEQGYGVGPCPHAPPILRAEFDADVTPAFRIYVATKEIMVAHLADMPQEVRQLAWPGLVDWHLANGRQSAGAIPILIGQRPLGILGFGWKEKVSFSAEELELLFSLTHQIAMMMELKQLAESQRQAAVTRERESAARERAEELARANDALQATIDALPSISDLEQFVLTVLRIVARAFGSTDCSYFEHFEGEPIRLRYWFRHGRVLRPAQLENLTDERLALIRDLAHGFTVPDDHLGTPVRQRTKPVILDHSKGTAVDRFDRFCVENGWDVELNVPLVIGGQADGAFLVYRGPGSSFTPAEITLAETLGKQLALAMQMSRLAKQARDAAVARERELEAERLASLLRGVVAASRDLLDEPIFDKGLKKWLGRLSEAAAADRAGIGRFDLDPAHSLPMPVTYIDWVRAGLGPLGETQVPRTADFDEWCQRLLRGESVWADREDLKDSLSRSYWETVGCWCNLIVPVMVDGRAWGWLYFDYCDRHPFDKTVLAVIQTAADGAAAAIRREQAIGAAQAEREASIVAREAAVAEERNRLAGEIHDSLAQSFAGIAMQLETAEDAAQCGETPVALSSTRRARELARFGLAEARRSVLALRPVTALAGGLEAAMKSLAERSSIDGLLMCSFTTTGPRRTLSTDCNFQLFRIAQEAVSNAVRHGRPSNVELSIDFGEQAITLRVADDGVGIDPARPVDASGGLTAIRQRVDRLKGKITIDSSPGDGTVLSVSVNFSECEQ